MLGMVATDVGRVSARVGQGAVVKEAERELGLAVADHSHRFLVASCVKRSSAILRVSLITRFAPTRLTICNSC